MTKPSLAAVRVVLAPGRRRGVAVRAAKGRWHQVVIICPETIKHRWGWD
jgi:hypothetical protein